MEVSASLPKPFPWLTVIPAVGSVLLSVGLAFGAAKFAQGETQKSIKTLEQRQEQFVTREELKIFMETTRDDLREIKENVRDIRSELHGR